MKILILEDNEAKFKSIEELLIETVKECRIKRVECLNDYQTHVNREKFDLLVVDLLVPNFRDSGDSCDVSRRIIESIIDDECVNFGTPVVAVTEFTEVADENISNFNKYNITVITYNKYNNSWKDSLKFKVKACLPQENYPVVIICALQKESDAFKQAGYCIGDAFVVKGLNCRTIKISEQIGILVTLPRMGLVSTAIATTRLLEMFEPKIVCMSGICGGVKGEVEIYDIIIPQNSYQHDAGKWGDEGFKSEIYSVQLDHSIQLELNNLTQEVDFKNYVKSNVTLKKDEFPKGKSEFDFNFSLATSSSGSAVIADNDMIKAVTGQHRKVIAFEMESFALYESVRQSPAKPIFFSAKSVVDNGTVEKNDKFHRIASLISAKAVYRIVEKLFEKVVK